MPSPVTRYFYSGSSRPQEENAGAPSERFQLFGNNRWSPTHHVLALNASAHFSCLISTCLFFSAYNTKENYK